MSRKKRKSRKFLDPKLIADAIAQHRKVAEKLFTNPEHFDQHIMVNSGSMSQRGKSIIAKAIRINKGNNYDPEGKPHQKYRFIKRSCQITVDRAYLEMYGFKLAS